ncbi:NRPS NcpA, partial [Streptomyces sp. PRh5]|uniref:non-ribosomal peptide synthetase n=1 Tax=Streptomyces sp. PRh5 TaxID=1158056 RepID=UPI000446AF6D
MTTYDPQPTNESVPASTMDPGIAELFERQAAATPEAVAVRRADEELTYRELDAAADMLAARLSRQAGPQAVVALLLEPGPALVTGILGVLKAGSAYLPLDPGYPTERLGFLITDAKAALVVAEAATAHRVPRNGRPMVLIDAPYGASPRPASHPSRGGSADDLAYLIHTSGSTGTPKGVAVPQRPLLELIRWSVARYRVSPDDVALPTHSTAFDAASRELLMPLLAGAGLVFTHGERRLDPRTLLREISHSGVTILDTVPSLLRRMLAEPDAAARLASLRVVVCGGEELDAETCDRFAESLPTAELMNQYGPTETTVAVTAWTCRPSLNGERVPIGHPLPGVRAYVLDEDGNPVADGAPGELCVGGHSLAHGYAGRPDLTANAFRPDPFAGRPGARLYWTGDRVRRRADGALEFLGRVDDQVQVRGYRIEPDEVAAALRRHPGVAEAVVVAHHGSGEEGEAALAAYVVPTGARVPSADLYTHLADIVPVFMLPDHLTQVAELPRTPAGKIDRVRLPEVAEQPYTAPEGRTAATIAALWETVLDRPRVGAFDDFFALGGDSLLATRVVIRIRERFGVDLPVRELFTSRTVTALAVCVDRASAVADSGALRRRDPARRRSLSFAQRRLWFLEQLTPGLPAYNVGRAYRICGPVDVIALTRALHAVVERHEVLRTRFLVEDGEPYQAVEAPNRAAALPVTDLSTDLDPVASARERSRATIEAPFDLAEGPLMRARLFRLADEDHVLLLAWHHSVFDGWSVGPFETDLTAAYQGRDLPELNVQYADFADWQREQLSEDRLTRRIGYWRKRLDGATLTLELPADRPRPPVPSYRGGSVAFSVPEALVGRLRALGRERGASLFMVTLAAFQVLIGRYTSRRDFVVGCPSAGRHRTELEELVGFFVNSLVVRADLSGDPSFAELVGRVRSSVLEAFEHQDLPFERLVEELAPPRDLSRNPVIQVWFDLFTAGSGLALGGASTRRFATGSVTTRFDVELHLADTRHGGLSGELIYASDLFDAASMERFAEHFLTLLTTVAEDSTAQVDSAEVLSAAERELLLSTWNDTGCSYRGDRTVSE